MESKIKDLHGCKKEIELEIPRDKVLQEQEKIVNQYKSSSKIPGFRQGKAPVNLIKRKFENDIKESLLNTLIPEALNKEIRKNNLNLISNPVINELDYKENQPIRFKAQFETWPEFELPEYKNIKVKKIETSVTDEEIENALKDLQERNAEYIPAEEREIVEGDYAVIELKEKEPKSNKNKNPERVLVEAGHSKNAKELNQNLIGSKPGDEKSFIVDYEKDPANQKDAGKKGEYEMKVISLKSKKIPEINDEFAKGAGGYKNLQELREKIKDSLQKMKDNSNRNAMAEQIIKTISSKVNIELPESLVKKESAEISKNLLSSQQGSKFNKGNMDQLKLEAQNKAKENIKNHLILSKIAEQEKINASESDVRKELEMIAKANNLSLSDVKDNINKEGRMENLRNNVLLKKTVDFLLESAIIN